MTVKPGSKFISVLRARLCLVTSIPAAACGIVSVFSALAASIAAAVFFIVFLVLWFWYLPSFADSCSIILSEKSVAVTRGVILRRKYIMPDSRAVYAERMRTPLSMLFGLTAVNIHLVRRILIFDGLEKDDADIVMAHLAEACKHG